MNEFITYLYALIDHILKSMNLSHMYVNLSTTYLSESIPRIFMRVDWPHAICRLTDLLKNIRVDP